MADVTLTDNEKKVLRAFWASEYGDGQAQPSIWSFSLTDNAGLAPRSMGGVVASLVKKGLVDCRDFSARSEESYATPTEAGLKAALDAGLIQAKDITGWNDTPRTIWVPTDTMETHT